MRYPLPSCPRLAGTGCWVYFIRAGRLVARARAEAFEVPGKPGKSYKGVSQPAAPASVVISSMAVLPQSRRIATQGFQGFRYLTDSDDKRFPRAF